VVTADLVEAVLTLAAAWRFVVVILLLNDMDTDCCYGVTVSWYGRSWTREALDTGLTGGLREPVNLQSAG
jgi:hypothetical protein